MGTSFGARRALERNAMARSGDTTIVHGKTPTRSPARVAAPAAPRKPPPGFRKHERRWRDASFILVERRRGKLYMYGSIAVATALWSYIYLFVRFI
jgi:hypothetical protein